jgi:hypothetical protein
MIAVTHREVFCFGRAPQATVDDPLYYRIPYAKLQLRLRFASGSTLGSTQTSNFASGCE